MKGVTIMNTIKVAVLGSTGSVGIQALDVIRAMNCEVVLLVAGSNAELLARQTAEFKPSKVAINGREAADRLRGLLSDSCTFFYEKQAILDEIRNTDADVIIHAISGLAGIEYALAAADSGKRIGMANKEAIVSCGDLIDQRLMISGGQLIPVDSEHSAIFQCLTGESDLSTQNVKIKRILLTASGGPFQGYSPDKLKNVTVEEALAHPTWKMGAKITIDSATLMNKGFEIMEAVRLFKVAESQVEVLVHRQSIIHSMVEFNDNTIKAVLSEPDMRYCIRYAMTCPQRSDVASSGLDFEKIKYLTFDKPDTNTFPLLNEARKAITAGGSAPTALIAADEAAVSAFLNRQIGFTDISSIVAELMGKIDIIYDVDEYNILEIAEYVKNFSIHFINKSYKGCGRH